MPGPMPKDPSIRQRRNKSITRSMLPAELAPIGRIPYLPRRPKGKGGWHKMARLWWHDVWTSPMHYEYLRVDVHALYRLVILVDAFLKSGTLEIAKEIRLLEREFGITPLSRRRLEWSVAQAEEARDRHEQKRSRRALIIDGDDPREVLSK